ncbi:MAG: GatB/Yqey domain protein [Candidatus Woesebacteria bacterium GW2011_GWB1_44_11]|uniref:GatB/Yqey domain protein n=1 Tax=Candidatus Woesebacteria bacterium GW2011_GWB1_44_11 TaxID=1618579 RepID=A0A837I5C3_9BACT|nr:MAG: GatB/Yqey domain protein [Candidatus Woesebacteria bacterium GW2011_GWB1_44_11]
MIAKTLQTKIGEAMKAHDETRTSTLRLLLSAFNYEQINKQHDLTEEEELAVIRREAKKRKEAVEMYKGAGADDRATKEEAELAILQEYLPPEMGEEELAKIIDEAFTQRKSSRIC